MTVRQTDELICSRIHSPTNEGGSNMDNNETPSPSIETIPETTPIPVLEQAEIIEDPNFYKPTEIREITQIVEETKEPTDINTPPPTPSIPIETIPTTSTSTSDIPTLDSLPIPDLDPPVEEPPVVEPINSMPNIDDLLRVDPPSQTTQNFETITPVPEPPVPMTELPTSNIPILGSMEETEHKTLPNPSVDINHPPVVEPVFDTLANNAPEGLVPEPAFKAAGDIKTAINSVRDTIKTIEKYGFRVEAEELDLENQYQITLKINKSND
jgi:hypothetical protein